MNTNPVNINMFLISGDITDIIKCSIPTWTGVVYKIPKDKLKHPTLLEREDLKYCGIYFLLGRDDTTGKGYIYIGQAVTRKNGDGVLKRATDHKNDRHDDYFSDVVLLTTHNDSFGPTEVSYLENQFMLLAKAAERYEVTNANEPNPGKITEEKESEMKIIIENTKMLMGALGYRVFIPYVKKSIESNDCSNEEVELFINKKFRTSNEILKAKCVKNNEGYIVLKGSMFEPVESKSIPENYHNLRERLLEDGIVKDGVFVENFRFTSPSAAASVILGASINGKSEWKAYS